jgi:branched-chain amino acid transport system ATP-binding protein
MTVREVYLLETKNLTKTFGGLRAIDDLDIYCNKGEVLGIIGPNGAGKTTLFNLLSGVYQPDSGKILFNGKPIERAKPHKKAQLGIGRTFQITQIFKNLNVLDNVLVAYGCKFYSHGVSFLGSFNKIKYLNESIELLKYVGLEEYEKIPAKNLPIGLQRKLEIARALALSPILLLLDESFSSLSYKESEDIMDLVKQIKKDGKTVMLIEHTMHVALDICDRIIVLNYGKVLATGAPEQIVRDDKVIDAYLGDEKY